MLETLTTDCASIPGFTQSVIGEALIEKSEACALARDTEASSAPSTTSDARKLGSVLSLLVLEA